MLKSFFIPIQIVAKVLIAFSFIVGSTQAAEVPTIAVSYFDNTSKKKDFEQLSKGLADMLITDLTKISALKVIERDKLELLLKEIKLNKSAYIDSKSAQQLGKGLGARFLLTGSFLLVGKDMRIDVRLLKVESGEVIMGESVQGMTTDFFTMEKKLAEKIVQSLKVRPRREESFALLAPETNSFEAFENYSAGLNAIDNKDYGEAQKHLKQAIQLDGGYDKALDALEKAIKALQSDVNDVKNKAAKIEDVLEIKLDPVDAKGHYSNALIYQKRQDIDNALKSYMSYFESKENFIDPVQNFSSLIREAYGEKELEKYLRNIYAKYPSRILEIFIEGGLESSFQEVNKSCTTKPSNKHCTEGKQSYKDIEQKAPWPYEKLIKLEKKYPDLLAPITVVQFTSALEMRATLGAYGWVVDPLMISAYSSELISAIDSGKLNAYIFDTKFLSLLKSKAEQQLLQEEERHKNLERRKLQEEEYSKDMADFEKIRIDNGKRRAEYEKRDAEYEKRKAENRKIFSDIKNKAKMNKQLFGIN